MRSSVIDLLRKELDDMFEEEIKEVYESNNRRHRSSDAITDIHPDIPITEVTPSRTPLHSQEGTLPVEIVSLEPMDGARFLANVVLGSAICAFDAGTNVFAVQDTLPVECRYMGKAVREGPIGSVFIAETRDEITLPSMHGPGWCVGLSYTYSQKVYRDSDDRIVRYYNEYLEAKSLDEDYNVKVFGVTPWLLRKRCDEGICNIIFKNLHEEDTRRHIFISTPSDFFMLRGEFFAVFLTPATASKDATIRVVSCTSRETVYDKKHAGVFNLDCCSTLTRGIVRCGRKNSTLFIIFYP